MLAHAPFGLLVIDQDHVRRSAERAVIGVADHAKGALEVCDLEADLGGAVVEMFCN